MDLASVIIVNWNGATYLPACLDSLQEQTYPNVEVIVVDNASTDGSRALLVEKYPWVRVVVASRNLGFAGGNNLGLREAGGRYLLLLNNDACVEPTWVAELVAVAEQSPKVGMCASKILSYANPTVIDNVGHVLYRDGLSRGRGRLEHDRGQYERIEEVIFPSGCAALYKREMIEEIGFFDEHFFAYCDDTDLGLRGRLAGWRCLYVPTAVAYHRYSTSSGSYSTWKGFLVERNHLWVVIKNLPVRYLLPVPVFMLLRLGLQAVGVVTRRGAAGRCAAENSPWTLMLTLLRAYASALRALPVMLRQRSMVQRRRRVSDSEVETWFRTFGVSAREIALKE